jgi:oligogalacturonide transport system permease protein
MKLTRITLRTITYLFLLLLVVIMIFPLAWLFLSSLKPNEEIFASLRLLPKDWIGFTAYREGWKGTGQYTYTNFFMNSFKMVFPAVFFTLIASTMTAYGFARFDFRFKKILFSCVIASLLLPHEVLIVPRYIMFNNFGWLNTYLPFTIPALLGTYSFFIFMFIQFIRGIPRGLDEAAYIDGCNSLQIFIRIIIPLSKPALFSATIFQFVWRWNDFFNPLIYITSVSKYPVALGLRMAIDVGETVYWNQNMALSILSLFPPVLIYFLAQKYFVEGISTTGFKG